MLSSKNWPFILIVTILCTYIAVTVLNHPIYIEHFCSRELGRT